LQRQVKATEHEGALLDCHGERNLAMTPKMILVFWRLLSNLKGVWSMPVVHQLQYEQMTKYDYSYGTVSLEIGFWPY
jgi:hypothetical protein